MWLPPISPGKVTLTSRQQGSGARLSDANNDAIVVQRQATSGVDATARRLEISRWDSAAWLGLEAEVAMPARPDDVAPRTGTTGAPVQRDGTGDVLPGLEVDVRATAETGVAGTGTRLPHLDSIQASFGHHDLSAVRAHVGGPAASAAAAATRQSDSAAQ